MSAEANKEVYTTKMLGECGAVAVFAAAALGVVACTSRDSLGERPGVIDKTGSSGAGTGASMTTDSAVGNGGTRGAGGNQGSLGGATAGSAGASARAGGTALGTGGSGSGGIGAASAGGSSVVTGGSANAGSGGAHHPGIDGGDVVQTLRIVTPSIVTPPGSEVHRCYHARVPSSTDVQAVAFRSSARALNELMVYRSKTDAVREGTLGATECALDQSAEWTYAAWAENYGLTMPSGVAEELVAQQPLLLDMHFVNTGGGEVMSSLSLEIDVAEGTFEQAAAIVSFNTSIMIPPRGTQTVSGDCTPTPGAKFFSLTTHTNRLATDASVFRRLPNGQVGEQLAHTTDSQKPAIAEWTSPLFLTFQAGEKLRYQCSYRNDGAAIVTVGTSALSNEMCMIIGYYFPAGPTSSCN